MTNEELALKNLSELEKTYRNASSTSMFSEFMRIYITVDDLAEAVKALEKQIPKKPRKSPFGNECFECGSVLDFGSVARFSFCPYCGQRIDWSDEE